MLDQLTKAIVVSTLGMASGGWVPFAALPWFRIIPSINTGTACGYFPQFSLLFTLAPFLILTAVVLFYRSQKQPSWILSAAIGLIIGGAIGNLVDRLRLGYVVDFVQIGGWPVFNVADAAVSTAVVILLLWSLLEEGAAQASAADGPIAPKSSWKLALVFIGILGVVAALGFIVCVYVPTTFR